MRFGPIIGAAQLAVGRGEGIVRFGDTPQAFMASLAPLVAFPLVGALLMAMSGRAFAALATLLLTLVAQLSPAVLSHALAVRWGREAAWLRYATAFNWCQWAIPVVAFGLLMGLQIATGAGLSDGAAANLLVLVLGAYGLFLHWIVARHGLALSRGRAVLMVVLVNVGDQQPLAAGAGQHPPGQHPAPRAESRHRAARGRGCPPPPAPTGSPAGRHARHPAPGRSAQD